MQVQEIPVDQSVDDIGTPGSEKTVASLSGKELYDNNCSSCHKADAQGVPSKALKTRKEIYAAIYNNVGGMVFLKNELTSNQLDMIEAYLASFKVEEPAPAPVVEPVKEAVITDVTTLRASVRQILDNNCISCHGAGAQYQSVVDLSVDLKVLEKNSKYITVKAPDNSYLYQKITTGSMAKYIALNTDRTTIYNWIKAVDGTEVLTINCPAGEAPLDNVCVKIGKVVRSYGYRMVTPDEMFKDINSIFKVNLSNKDPISGQNIVPEPLTTHGFANQFGLVSANSVFVTSMEHVANMLENVLMSKTDFNTSIVSCMADTVVNCGMQIAKNVYIPKLFRRELSDSELLVYKNYFETATGTKKEIYINFFKALIQSPSFLFREEHGVNPSPLYLLEPYEVASRLSYFILGKGPDAELRKVAADGSILQKSVRIAQAERLMTKLVYESNTHLANVFMESIGIKEKNLAHDAATSADMIKETRWIVRDIFFNFDRKWTDVFSLDYTYVNKRLSDIYGFNASSSNTQWVKVVYPDAKRSGILSHASYLSAFYDGKDLEKTNDIRRGINFYEKILCRNMPLPPPDVDIDLDPASELTGCRIDNRKKSTLNPQGSCVQCHQHFDRIGMGFERFNNMGEYREVEKDRTSCSTIENFYLDGATQFNTMPEFTKAVSENNNVGRCLALKMKSYAYGSEIGVEHLKSIFLEMNTFQKTMKFKDLIKDIVGNDQFIKREGRDEI